MEISTKSKIKKIILVLILLIIAYFVFDAVYFYGKKWWGERQVQKLAETLEKYQQDLFDKKAADKIGGKTPQETLQMFIDAVEKGDYDLASKYFVVEKQKQELKNLQNSPEKNIENVMKLLKQSQYSDDGYSSDRKRYIIHDPLFVSFDLYPSGNWKIEEI